MAKLKLILCLFCITVLVFSNFTLGYEEEEKEAAKGQEKKTTVKLQKSTGYYWNNVRRLINQVQTYLYPPTLDFRGSKGGEGNAEGVSGAGEKVKEAVLKTKSAMEDSAKSAANMAGETLQKTAKKVKKSLTEAETESERDTHPRAQAEL